MKSRRRVERGCGSAVFNSNWLTGGEVGDGTTGSCGSLNKGGYVHMEITALAQCTSITVSREQSLRQAARHL